MITLIRRMSVVLALGLLCLVSACGKDMAVAPAPLPDVTIGVVGVSQPMGTTDLLAGFIPENRVLASSDAVLAFNNNLMQMLKKQTQRVYTFVPQAGGVNPSQKREAGRNGALAQWAEIGRKMKVDLLIVPQILDWRERAGSEAGVTTAAAVNVDFFLIDVRTGNGTLISRSNFREQQVGLSDNLMNFNTFIKRGGKWITASELAQEGMEKMIREFGL